MANRIPVVCYAILATILAPICRADDQLPSKAVVSIKKVCPAVHPESIIFTTGDLNGDGFPDVAAIVVCKYTEYGEPQDELLMVLFGKPDGSYQSPYRSQTWAWNGRSEEELANRRGTLVFSAHCAYNCNPENWRSRYTFATRRNRFVLIGEDYVQTIMSGKDLELESESGQTVNYLTNRGFAWSKEENRAYSENQFSIKGTLPPEFTDFNLDSCLANRSCARAHLPDPSR